MRAYTDLQAESRLLKAAMESLLGRALALETEVVSAPVHGIYNERNVS
jgi:hypothetical protein